MSSTYREPSPNRSHQSNGHGNSNNNGNGYSGNNNNNNNGNHNNNNSSNNYHNYNNNNHNNNHNNNNNNSNNSIQMNAFSQVAFQELSLLERLAPSHNFCSPSHSDDFNINCSTGTIDYMEGIYADINCGSIRSIDIIDHDLNVPCIRPSYDWSANDFTHISRDKDNNKDYKDNKDDNKDKEIKCNGTFAMQSMNSTQRNNNTNHDTASSILCGFKRLPYGNLNASSQNQLLSARFDQGPVSASFLGGKISGEDRSEIDEKHEEIENNSSGKNYGNGNNNGNGSSNGHNNGGYASSNNGNISSSGQKRKQFTRPVGMPDYSRNPTHTPALVTEIVMKNDSD